MKGFQRKKRLSDGTFTVIITVTPNTETMKKALNIAILIVSQIAISQTAFYNAGKVQVHNGAQVGFHTDLINDGDFNNNKGLTGLYSTNDLIISGINKPVFYDLEVAVENNVYLMTSVGVTNSHNFIVGQIITPRDNANISFELLNNAVYAGEGNATHVDGYATTSTGLGYVLPVGNGKKISPITINNNISSPVTAAYYNGNLNFNNESKGTGLKNVNHNEVWDVKGNEAINITLSWDATSNLTVLTNSTENLSIVGWDKQANEWVTLGNLETTGNLTEGTITSISFVPNHYEAITIGSTTTLENGTDEVIIADAKIIKTNVFDTAGRLVKTFKGTEEVNFDGLAKGVFITNTYLSNGERFAKKILNN